MTEDTNTSETPAATDEAPASAPASQPSGDDGEVVIEELDPVEEAKAEAAQMKEKLMRTAADFDNYRKRSRREVADAEKKGRDGLLTDLLPVFDNLERATAHADASDGEGDGVKGLVDGINLVMKQFRDALGRLGIERVQSVGQPFDPSLHEAIQHLETEEHPPGCVAAEVQPGYREGERLVRPALVVVAKAPAQPAKAEESGQDTSESSSNADASPESEAPAGENASAESPEA